MAAAAISVGNPADLEMETESEPMQTGMASWYGRGFHGRKTANGERYNMHELTCASKHLPFGTMLEVTNLDNGEKVVVRVNDRGPYIKKRIIDLSYAAAKQIRMLHKGQAKVEIRETSEENNTFSLNDSFDRQLRATP